MEKKRWKSKWEGNKKQKGEQDKCVFIKTKSSTLGAHCQENEKASDRLEENLAKILLYVIKKTWIYNTEGILNFNKKTKNTNLKMNRNISTGNYSEKIYG